MFDLIDIALAVFALACLVLPIGTDPSGLMFANAMITTALAGWLNAWQRDGHPSNPLTLYLGSVQGDR